MAAGAAQLEADVVLRDGSTAHVRPARADDEPALLRFLDGLGPESRWFRFFSGAPNLGAAAHVAAAGDTGGGFGLLAVLGGEIVAHACFQRTGEEEAEVAFAVADALQGHGLATTLLAHLAQAADARGITTLTAEVLPSNHRMLRVLRDSGFPLTIRSDPGVLVLQCPARLDEDARRRFAQRDDLAAVAAVSHVLRPASVAVVGASRRPGTVGRQVVENLRDRYHGRLYAVNPRTPDLGGVPVHPTVLDIPGDLELAVIAVAAPRVLDVARQCAAKGVKALVVLSAGFAEAPRDGRARQEELLAICRAAGMRLVGPNCLGVINTDPDVGLDATFAPEPPPPGAIGFFSQSGALAIAALGEARSRGLGISSLVSVGDKADLSGNDLLRWWERDARTTTILLYLESFGNPRSFGRLARRIGTTTPIVALKAGRTPAGARAASSHTGALLAAADVPVDALFAQAGVIRTATMAELFDVGALLAGQPLPPGDRVAILTNAGGPGILCADACVADGLRVEPLDGATQQRLREQVPQAAAVANPVDLLATARGQDYERALAVLLEDPAVDAVIAIFIPPLATRAEDVDAALRRTVAATSRQLPVLAVFLGGPASAPGGDGHPRLPSYPYPEEAARALARVAGHARWRRRDPGTLPDLPGAAPEEAAAAIAGALAHGGGWLDPAAVERLLRCYGIAPVESRFATTAQDAGAAAAELGGAVALKGVAPGLVHKTDEGGVRLGLRGRSAVERAAGSMGRALHRRGRAVDGFLVQPMVPAGPELLIGIVQDPSFGPLVACGAGGTAAELLGDVAVRLAPLTDADAREMLRDLRTFPLLAGHRGAAPADVEALEGLLLRVGALAGTHPEVAELDLNPVIAGPRGPAVVDARVRLRPLPPAPPVPSLGADC